MMLDDPDLTAVVTEACAFLDVSLAQLWGNAPGWPDFGNDPMSYVRGLNRFRAPLESAGVSVPEIVDPDIDPIGHMTEWRDFLAKLVTVH